MDRFSKLHPIMQILFFASSIIIVISASNPIVSVTSLICAILYGARLKGRGIFSFVKMAIILTLIVGCVNMAFSHYGADVLFVINETEYSLESLAFGLNQGVVLSAVIIWFDLFSNVADSERITYLFRFAPRCALIFSMVIGFLPRFSKKLRDIRNAKKALFGTYENLGIKERFSNGVDALSALVTYSLEASIITADSMVARGYNPKIISHSRFRLRITDIMLIIFISLVTIFSIVQLFSGRMSFVIDERIYIESFSVVTFILITIMELLPLIIDFAEDLLWKLSGLKA